MAGVINLAAEKQRREHEAGHAAHEAGEAFAFLSWDYDDDAIGYIDGDRPFSILFEPEEGRGVAMSRESAERLRDAITEALASPHAPWNGGDAVGE